MIIQQLRNQIVPGIVFVCFISMTTMHAAAHRSSYERMQERTTAREMKRAAQKKEIEQQCHIAAIRDDLRKARALERDACVTAWDEQMRLRELADERAGRYAHLYALPSWPAALHYFKGKLSCAASYTFTSATSCYNDDGSRASLSCLRVGSSPQPKDVLLASKLTVSNGATPAAGHEFLQDLARTPLDFSVKYTTQTLGLSFAGSFFNERCFIGLSIPLTEHVRTLSLQADTTAVASSLLRTRTADEETGAIRNSVFRDLYGVDTSQYIIDVLQQKGLQWYPRLEQTGVNDLELFCTVSLLSKKFERFLIGGSLIWPAAPARNEQYFYPIEIGNGGFFSGKIYASAMSNKTALGHLHGMVSVSTGFPATVTRRVPPMVTLRNVSTLTSNQVYGPEITFSAVRTINEPETEYAAFSNSLASVSLQPGVTTDVHVGSIITPFVTREVQCDVFYHLQTQTSDTLYAKVPLDVWYAEALVQQRLRLQHSCGALLTYQPTSHMQFRLGGSFVFAGVSVSRTLTGTASLSYEW